MRTAWGWLLIVFTGLLCWAAQVLNALAPAQAERLGLSEPESEVDATFMPTVMEKRSGMPGRSGYCRWPGRS